MATNTVKGTLLVVEDEAYVRESLASVLERRGYAVTTSASVEEALSRRQHEGVDLVLTDLKLPGESGLALVQHLAAGGPPVVVLTGHGTVASAVECIKAGAADADRNGQIFLNEWFNYATDRVPTIRTKKELTRKELEEVDEDEKRVQRPRVFNMRQGGAERFMIARTAASTQLK